jgi:hypothetical protein
MASKRFKKLPEKTKDLASELIEKLLSDVIRSLSFSAAWLLRHAPQ